MNKDFEDIKISKKLENEYKTLIHQDVPDLWSRIEAGLETKEQSQNAVIDSSFTNNNISNQKVVKFKRKYKMWGTVAAACACVAIAIPVFTNNMNKGSMESATNSEYSAADTVVSDNYAVSDNPISQDDIGGTNIKDFNANDYIFKDDVILDNSEETTDDIWDMFDAEVLEETSSEKSMQPSAKVKIISSKKSEDIIIYKAVVLEGFGESGLFNGDEIEIHDIVSEELLASSEEYELALEEAVDEDGEKIYYIDKK